MLWQINNNLMLLQYWWENYLRVSSFSSYAGLAPLDTLTDFSIFSAVICGVFLEQVKDKHLE